VTIRDNKTRIFTDLISYIVLEHLVHLHNSSHFLDEYLIAIVIIHNLELNLSKPYIYLVIFMNQVIFYFFESFICYLYAVSDFLSKIVLLVWVYIILSETFPEFYSIEAHLINLCLEVFIKIINFNKVLSIYLNF